jgi:hypothetical protein
MQAKGIENIFNKIRAENSSSLEEIVIWVQEAYRRPNKKIRKEHPIPKAYYT